MQRYTRLTQPFMRPSRGAPLEPASWDAALGRVAAGFGEARERGATRSFGLFSCSKATNEMNYAAQKLARGAMGSNNVDSCNRT
jgi:formate dehydrogenase major subunit